MRHSYLFALAALLGTYVHAQDDHLDPSFGDNGRVTLDPLGGGAYFHALAVQPDGRIVCAGTAQDATEHKQGFICRFLTNGQLDPDFSGDGMLFLDPLGNGASLSAMELLDNGDLQVAGGALVNGHFRMLCARLHTDGTFDEGFGTNGVFWLDGKWATTACMVILADGSSVLAGGRDLNDGVDGTTLIIKLDPLGVLDPSFGENGMVEFHATNQGHGSIACSIALMNDGSFLVGGYEAVCESRSMLFRVLENGVVDPQFNDGAGAFYTAIPPGDGCDIGWVSSVNRISPEHVLVTQSLSGTPLTHGMIVRKFDITGAIDASFGDNGVIAHDGSYNGISMIDEQDRLLMLEFTDLHDVTMTRFDLSGSQDLSFMGNGSLQTSGLDASCFIYIDAFSAEWELNEGNGDFEEKNDRIYFCAGTFSDTKAALWAFSETFSTSASTLAPASHAIVFPQPANDHVLLTLPDHTSATPIELVNDLGQVVHRAVSTAGARELRIDLADLPSGAYAFRTTGLAPQRLLIIH